MQLPAMTIQPTSTASAFSTGGVADAVVVATATAAAAAAAITVCDLCVWHDLAGILGLSQMLDGGRELARRRWAVAEAAAVTAAALAATAMLPCSLPACRFGFNRHRVQLLLLLLLLLTGSTLLA